MGRYRSRSRSYSPRRSRTPPRRYRLDDPPDRHRGQRSRHDRRSLPPTGLLVRNISLDARPEDLRIPFERFGPVKDVYLPKNYYTGELRGFGFVKFRNAGDAAEAKYHLNHTIIDRREIEIVFAEENRKTPQEMNTRSHISGRYEENYRRQSPPSSPKHRYRSYSRSQSPVRHDSRKTVILYRGKDLGAGNYYSPSHLGSISRCASPRGESTYWSKHKSLSSSDFDRRPTSTREKNRRPHDKRDYETDPRPLCPRKG